MAQIKDNLLKNYNYDEFIPAKFGPWMRFDQNPKLGEPAPDFPIWDLDEQKTNLSDIWKTHLYTVVEFGSFT